MFPHCEGNRFPQRIRSEQESRHWLSFFDEADLCSAGRAGSSEQLAGQLDVRRRVATRDCQRRTCYQPLDARLRRTGAPVSRGSCVAMVAAALLLASSRSPPSAPVGDGAPARYGFSPVPGANVAYRLARDACTTRRSMRHHPLVSSPRATSFLPQPTGRVLFDLLETYNSPDKTGTRPVGLRLLRGSCRADLQVVLERDALQRDHF